jgi:hypothetical protein
MRRQSPPGTNQAPPALLPYGLRRPLQRRSRNHSWGGKRLWATCSGLRRVDVVGRHRSSLFIREGVQFCCRLPLREHNIPRMRRKYNAMRTQVSPPGAWGPGAGGTRPVHGAPRGLPAIDRKQRPFSNKRPTHLLWGLEERPVGRSRTCVRHLGADITPNPQDTRKRNEREAIGHTPYIILRPTGRRQKAERNARSAPLCFGVPLAWCL